MKSIMTMFVLFILLGSPFQLQAQGGQHTFIESGTYTIRPDAGMPKLIRVWLLRNDSPTSLTLTVRLEGSANFSMDSLDQSKTLKSGRDGFVEVSFLSDSGGTFTTLFTVTDGTVIDSAYVTAIVTPRPFALLPQNLVYSTNIGVPLPMSATIRNLTGVEQTIGIAITGDPEFIHNGQSPILLPAYASHVVTINFLATTEGEKYATLQVSCGDFFAETRMLVSAFGHTYKWISNITNPGTEVNRESEVKIRLLNTSGVPVTLDVSLTGDAAFQLDSGMNRVTFDNYTYLTMNFVSPVEGRHSTLLTVTDGVDIDTVTVWVYVLPTPANFAFELKRSYLKVKEHDTVSTDLTIWHRNRTNLPLTLNASIDGDSRFSIDGSWPVVLPANGKLVRTVRFSGAAPGEYTARIAISDGDTSITSVFTVRVDPPFGGNSKFLVEQYYDGKAVFFAAPPGGTDSKTLHIRNVSDETIGVNLSLYNGGGFILSTDSLTIDSGMTAPVTITFSNPPIGITSTHLRIQSGAARTDILLRGETAEWSSLSGLKMMNYLDFGEVDTTTQYFRDLLLINETTQDIVISDVELSGLAPDFSIASDTSFSIHAGDTAAVSICYAPTMQIIEDYDVVTFTCDNPAATPRVQSLSLGIRGLSKATRRVFFDDSVRIRVAETHTMIAPIDGYVEKTLVLQNPSSRNVVFAQLPNFPPASPVFTFLTQQPITIPAWDSLVPGSGTTTIRVRYAPTSAVSVPNVDEHYQLSFWSDDSLPSVWYGILIFGKPLTPISSTNIIPLYPENQLPPMITLGEAEVESHHVLRFRNNLGTPITITSCGLESGSYAELVDHSTLPVELQPNETISIELKVIATVQALTSDAIIMHGSHDNLNSRYEIFSGKMSTGISDPPTLPGTLSIVASPNPFTSSVTIHLDNTLRNARIRILDMLGRTLTDVMNPTGSLTWNASVNGQRAPAGMYFIHATGIDGHGRHVDGMRKLVLLP